AAGLRNALRGRQELGPRSQAFDFERVAHYSSPTGGGGPRSGGGGCPSTGSGSGPLHHASHGPPPLTGGGTGDSGRQALAALGATPRNDLLSVLGGHPRTEAVTALAHESRRLIGPLHVRLLGLNTKRRRNAS